MAIIKRSSLDIIEIHRNGATGIRLVLEVFDEETGEVLSSAFHRTMIDGDVTPEQQMGFVNTHLVAMGWPEVPATDIADIVTYDGVNAVEKAEKRAVRLEAQRAPAVSLDAPVK